MKKIIIFGNSGSGKSTLANKLSTSQQLAHLDLDTIAWQTGPPAQRKAIENSQLDIITFCKTNSQWVIEGCYSDLLSIAIPYASEIIYLNLSINACIKNAEARPWEPHKYACKADQDKNLEMLINWISQYDIREDTFSKSAHQALYQNFSAKKSLIDKNI